MSGFAWQGRHPSTTHFEPLFAFEHLPVGVLRDTSRECGLLVDRMVRALPDGPELSAGLRKLLEAKDCFVRAALPNRPQPAEVEAPPRSIRDGVVSSKVWIFAGSYVRASDYAADRRLGTRGHGWEYATDANFRGVRGPVLAAVLDDAIHHHSWPELQHALDQVGHMPYEEKL